MGAPYGENPERHFRPEAERAEHILSPIDLYTQYRLLHRPDQMAHFLTLLNHAANNTPYIDEIAPVLEASSRHLGKFGVNISDDPLQNFQTLVNLRRNYDMLPSPDSIPVADISSCWDSIVVEDGMIAVDYSLNGMWDASGDTDAALVHKHLHLFTGSTDTRHRILTDIDPTSQAFIEENFLGSVQRKDIDAIMHHEVGEELNLKDILIKNMKVYFLYHGFGGNIDAFYGLTRKWLAKARSRGQKATFITIEGLGANGTKADQFYRDIYQVEPDSITIPRYGEQIYHAMLASGIAGLEGIKKTYIGFSMGAAALNHAHDYIIRDEQEIRESRALKGVRERAVNGEPIDDVQNEERVKNTLETNEPLEFFPSSAIFYCNPAYEGVTTLGGVINPEAPLSIKIQAKLTRALLHLGQLTGKNVFRRLPVRSVVDYATDVLMGGGVASPDRIASSKVHSRSIRHDPAVPMQEAGLIEYTGLQYAEVLNTNRNNIAAYTFFGKNDRITLRELQRRVNEEHARILKAAGDNYIPNTVFETPNGHGFLLDEFMEDGPVLLDVLADLSAHDRLNVGLNRELIQLAINNEFTSEQYREIAVLAQQQEERANIRTYYDPSGERNSQPIYPTLQIATPELMKSHAFRARFVAEYIQLIRNRFRNPEPPQPQ